MHIAFVVQRYGLDVNGGAELLCRMVAGHMAKYWDVEVLTSCAIDYITWQNKYPPGKDKVDGISIRRFPVDKPRNIRKFNRFYRKIMSQGHSRDDEINWMRLQGPNTNGLFKYIEENKDQYDAFIFFTYLYCTTYFGLPIVHEKAFLVPTAHDEPPIYFGIFKEIFQIPRGLIFSTHAEKAFVNRLFNNENIPSRIIGGGIELPEDIDGIAFRSKYGIQDDFVLYAGRIDESKGCGEMFDYFLRWTDTKKDNTKLVLMGRPIMKIPKDKRIIHLGFVPEKDKFAGMKAAKLLVMPSFYESFSIVILESWLIGKPVLVNGKCEVLLEQCRKSNGGLYYENYHEFSEALDMLISDDKLRLSMGNKGKEFTENNYNWDIVEKKYLEFIK